MTSKAFTTSRQEPVRKRHRAASLYGLWLIFLLSGISPLLYAQTDEPRFTRRIIWRGGEHALHHVVEIERREEGMYRNHLRALATTPYLQVSLPPGEYRFRITPYDILGRPAGASPWFHFAIRYVPVPEPALVVPSVAQKPVITRNRFNTLGASVGTSFTDPLVIATVHGTFSPVRSWFIELGVDIGFASVHDDVERYYSIFPFAHIGYFFPFRERGGFFIGAGAGYMIGNYTFSHGEAAINVFSINVTAGVNLFDFLNISYTLRTDFRSMNSKIAAGYVFRFR